MSGPSAASSAASSSTATSSSDAAAVTAGVTAAKSGVITSGIGMSGVGGSSTASNVISAGLVSTSGMLGGGFTFFGSSGSGSLLTSRIDMVSGVGSAATAPPVMSAPVDVTVTWPTVSALATPSAGALAAPIMIPQYPGGGFGKKLDNKPPVMQGSFDLYAVQLKTFWMRLNLWCVVENEAAVRASVSDVQFAMMDNIARGAILHGVPTADAELICHETSAQGMWTSFVNKQTKREYANYIFARQRLYANKYSHEQNMNEWLREMQLLGNELLHYEKVISDEEFAEILLSNVAQTHRELFASA